MRDMPSLDDDWPSRETLRASGGTHGRPEMVVAFYIPADGSVERVEMPRIDFDEAKSSRRP